MGSIASVLQWHCSECALINPTESTRCARCGLTRLKSDEKANLRVSLSVGAEKIAEQEGKEKKGDEDKSDSCSVSVPPTLPPRLRLGNSGDDTHLTTQHVETDHRHR